MRKTSFLGVDCGMGFRDPPLIVHVVHSLAGGGTERTLVSLLHAFDAHRLRHAVVTLRMAGQLAAKLPDHVACRAVAANGRSRSVGIALASVMREWGAAVVHARNTGCWFDATVASILTPGTQLVLGFHGLETTEPLSRRHRWVARAARLCGARFTSVSQTGGHQLRTWAQIPQDRIDVLVNGIDLDRFTLIDSQARRQIRDSLGLHADTLVVGTVGSLTPIKRQGVLIEACAHVLKDLSNIHLLIVGNGPLRTSLVDQARRAGIADRVHFTGWREDVPALLSCVDVYVCSSAAEGMSNALLEALAAGLPIIATNVGDNPFLVRDQIEGRIVPANDPLALGKVLRQFATAPGLRDRYAEAAKARAADFRFDRTVQAYETYYEALAAKLGASSWTTARGTPSAQPA